MRKLIAVIAGVLVLLAVNLSIINKEALLTEGRIIYLALAPADPRSLMQGDYMALRFKLEAEVLPLLHDTKSGDGNIVVALDEKGVATLRRRDDGRPLAGDEARIQYRLREGVLKFATNAFFFQEGQGASYANARYGEFRAGSDGEMILTGLRDEELRRLGAE